MKISDNQGGKRQDIAMCENNQACNLGSKPQSCFYIKALKIIGYLFVITFGIFLFHSIVKTGLNINIDLNYRNLTGNNQVDYIKNLEEPFEENIQKVFNPSPSLIKFNLLKFLEHENINQDFNEEKAALMQSLIEDLEEAKLSSYIQTADEFYDV